MESMRLGKALEEATDIKRIRTRSRSDLSYLESALPLFDEADNESL